MKWEVGVIIPDCDAGGDWQNMKLYKVIGNEWSRIERYMTEEHWFSTCGLLCYLAHKGGKANLAKRERCRDLLHWFLQRSCPGEDTAMALQEAGETQRSVCTKQALGGRCLCFPMYE
eukprot:921524-Amphidinium_carterae.1